jgi:hypothetical protein
MPVSQHHGEFCRIVAESEIPTIGFLGDFQAPLLR